MIILKTTLKLFIFVLLTALTQIGGLAFIVGLWLANRFTFRFRKVVLVLGVYFVFTFLIVPILAPFFGRERITNTEKIGSTSYMTVLLNRNYIKPQLNIVLRKISNKLPEKMQLRYLDANFPFINHFPLLPHLSHNDGKKIDLSFMYVTAEGKSTNLKPSRSGYGIFEEPKKTEFNQTTACLQSGYWQYDYPKYLTLGTANKGLVFDEQHTKLLMKAILSEKQVSKVFIEKHLKDRMQLQDQRLRFQGCRAVRHDDHIHIQIK